MSGYVGIALFIPLRRLSESKPKKTEKSAGHFVLPLPFVSSSVTLTKVSAFMFQWYEVYNPAVLLNPSKQYLR